MIFMLAIQLTKILPIDQKTLDVLTLELSMQLGEEMTVFVNTREIALAKSWEGDLARSKILLPILTPSYAMSVWTVSEWETFRLREDVTGQNLVFPVLAFGDTAHYPVGYCGVNGSI